MPDLPSELIAQRYCCGSLCNPRSPVHRYAMLFFICLMSFGSYFCYDNPAALQDAFLTDLNLSVAQFMNLYAFYSWPNVILSFIGGLFIDRVIGIRWGAILFSSIIFFGQCLFSLGSFLSSVYLMYFARFVFGVGGESLSVAQNAYATAWYPPNELNFVFGLSLSVARIGSTVNMNTMRPLYKAMGSAFHLTGGKRMAATLLVASVTCLFSIGCAISLAFFYRRYVKARLESLLSVETSGESSQEAAAPQEEVIQLKDILHFPPPIWLICIICVAYYVTVFPLISLGLVFFKRKYGLDPAHAAALNSLVFIVSAVASPIVGAAIDFFGYNLTWVTVGIAMAATCHACFAFTAALPSPFLLMLCLGLSYSILASSLWPLVGVVLPQHQRATAYGLVQSVQNLGLGLASFLAGYIVDTKGYMVLEMFFLMCNAFALLATVLLFLWDVKNGRRLNSAHTRTKATPVKPEEEAEVGGGGGGSGGGEDEEEEDAPPTSSDTAPLVS